MATYWCVTSVFFDSGRTIAKITGTVNADTKPNNTYTELRDRDVYTDWFGDIKEANKHVEEAKRA